MIDDKNFFDQPIHRELKTNEIIRKIATGKGDDYTTGFSLDYSYFKENYKMIAIDLSKQQTLDADPRAIQQINFCSKFRQSRKYKNVLYYWKRKRNCTRLFTRNCKSFVNTILLNAILLSDLIFIKIK